MKLSAGKRHFLPTLGKLIKHTNPTSLSKDVCVCNCWHVGLSVHVLMNASDAVCLMCCVFVSLDVFQGEVLSEKISGPILM